MDVPHRRPFIYLQYVKNAAAGHWFEYNIGERSGGMTGLLWFLLLVVVYAPLRWLGADPGSLIFVSHFVSTVTTILTLYIAARRLVGKTSAWTLGLCVAPISLLWPQYLWACWGGLEGPLASLVAVFAFATFETAITTREKFMLPGVVGGLLYAVRPESVALVFFLAGLFLVFGRSRSFAERRGWVLRYLAVVLATCGMTAAIYYGFTGFLTPSALIKFDLRAVLRNPAVFLSILAYFQTWIAIIAVLALLLLVLVFVSGLPLRAELAVTLSLGLLLLSDIALGIFPNSRDRYLSWMTPIIATTLLSTLGGIQWRFLPKLALSRPCRAVVVGVSIPAVVGFASWYGRAVFAADARCIDDLIVAPAAWIGRNTSRDDVIASEPIGATKFLNDERSFIDIVGVTSPIARGTYTDWPKTWSLVEHAGASYFIFYPEALPASGKPFLEPVATFANQSCAFTTGGSAVYRVNRENLRAYLRTQTALQ